MVLIPKYDDRTAREIAEEVHALLSAGGWRSGSPQGLEEALIQIFARFSELVIHRLNQAPEKNYLAFLDLLGVSQLPMQAARVPLTFSMALGSASCARVPKGTQVAAPPGPGQQKPIMFETERELTVTPARLDSLLIKFGSRDQYWDLGSVLLLPSDTQAINPESNAAMLSGTSRIPHLFYISFPVTKTWPQIDRLKLRFGLSAEASATTDPRLIQWELAIVDQPLPVLRTNNPTPVPDQAMTPKVVLSPGEDGTKDLTQSGEIIFLHPPLVAPVTIDGVVGNWISCRLLTPITPSAEPVDGMVRSAQLPSITQIGCTMELARQSLALDQAFYNTQKLDLSKDFLPFGERPKFGDVFYIGSREVFSDPDARITLHVELTNTAAQVEDASAPSAKDHDIQLNWEFWNGQAWSRMAKSRILRMEGDPAESELEDKTNSFLDDGDVKLKFNSPPRETMVNGQKNFWIRVRITAGNYGEDVHFQKNAVGLVAIPATFVPPSIKSIKVDYDVKKEAVPNAVVSYNDFSFSKVDCASAFKPFIPARDASTSVFVGFAIDPPAAAKPPLSGALPHLREGHGKFPNQAVTAYVSAGDGTKSGEHFQGAVPGYWGYWTGTGWRKLTVSDETERFSRSGLIQFLPPPDFVTKEEFGRERYWLKMLPDGGELNASIRHVYLNTTMALQGMSVVNDVLGSSDGKAGQKFQTIQTMVLPGQKLEVREPNLPARNECERIKADEGAGAINSVKDAATKADQYWVTWHEVPNFYGSGARDRHYVIDRPVGQITFGDGVFGLIPPKLAGNIRMTSYRSGGGAAGNQPSQAVTKLTSVVPYIQKVTNWLPASGGNDPEKIAALLERGSRGVRHGRRAVTVEDFEDLAMLASRDVARAKCIPLYDLSPGPAVRHKQPGIVSVIVLPRSTDAHPVPSPELLEQVRGALDASRLPTTEVILVRPEYVFVNVDAEIAVSDFGEAGGVEVAVRREIENYLHPVTGGPDSSGWEFGRLPQKFALSLRIETISGVSHVREIHISIRPERPGVEKTNYFLVCCGDCRIAMVLEEQLAAEFA